MGDTRLPADISTTMQFSAIITFSMVLFSFASLTEAGVNQFGACYCSTRDCTVVSREYTGPDVILAIPVSVITIQILVTVLVHVPVALDPLHLLMFKIDQMNNEDGRTACLH